MTRRRYVYRMNDETGHVESFEIGEDYQTAERRAPMPTEELVYGRAVATDGTDLSTKRRFRAYLKATGATHASDYSAAHYEKKQAERAKLFTPGSGYDKERRKRAIVEAVHKVEAQKGRRR